MKNSKDIHAIVQALKDLYPDGICSLQYQKDYELLFATRLSAQCTDERVNQVTPALFARFPTLEALAEKDLRLALAFIYLSDELVDSTVIAEKMKIALVRIVEKVSAGQPAPSAE